MSIFGDYKGSNFNPLNWMKNEDPSKAANRYLDQIPGIGQKYYDPFINEGREAGGVLKGEYGKMLSPTSFIDEIMKHYSMSKGAEYEHDKLGRGIGATAAAGGFAGTPEHQREYGEMAHNIMSSDMQQFLQNALGVYNTGLSGEHDIYNKGFDASGSMADLLGGTASSKAGLSFASTQQRNADRQAFMNALMKALTTAGGSFSGAI